MSAGNFARSKYQADDGEIYPIRIQPETALANVGAVNAAPTGSTTQSLYAKARKGVREYGVGARSVTVAFTAQPPAGYAENQTYRIPILTPTVYSGITVGATGTYLTVAIQVVSKSPERVR